MSRIEYTCPACRSTVPGPPSLAGASAPCPKCGAMVDGWPAADGWSPSPVEPPPLPGATPLDPPVGALVACYALVTAGTLAVFMPCVWMFGVPLVAAAFVVSVFLYRRFGGRSGLLACVIVSGIGLFVGLALTARIIYVMIDRDGPSERNRSLDFRDERDRD